jgi:integrase
MASLRKLRTSPYWIACYTLPDGTRTNRSTKTTDKALAKRMVLDWQEAANSAREGRFVESQARKVLNDILERVGQDKISSDTVASFLKDWLTGKDNPGTADRYGHTVKLFKAHLGRKQHSIMTAISHKDILGFIETRRNTGAASKTISVDLKALNTAFNLARKLGFITSNPVERALALKPIEVESSEKEQFSPVQVHLLLKEATGDWLTIILLGFYTGARLGDCANMEWSNVNFTDDVIEYCQQKTGKRVVVPLHPDLDRRLQTLASSDKPAQYLCPSLAHKGSSGKNGLSECFKRLMARTGIDPQSAKGQGTKNFSKLSFHSLRHSFNSTLANLGIDQETRMALTGHSSKAINNDYTHLELPKLKAAISRLPSLL